MTIKSIDPAGGVAAEALRATQNRRDEERSEESVAEGAASERQRAAEAAGITAEPARELSEGGQTGDAVEATEGVKGSEAPRGDEMHREATETASAQQDRGEDWQEFSGTEQERDLPPTVEDQARETDEERAQKDEVKVADLLKEIAIGSGKIHS